MENKGGKRLARRESGGRREPAEVRPAEAAGTEPPEEPVQPVKSRGRRLWDDYGYLLVTLAVVGYEPCFTTDFQRKEPKMCKSISPASFLALAFSRSKKEKMTYSELEACRGKITSVRSQSGEAFDVDWSHDAVRFAMGFYSPIFRDDGADILCNQEK